MARSYMPRQKAAQVAWAKNLQSQIGSTPAPEYGLSMTIWSPFLDANATLQQAWATAQNPATRTAGAIITATVALADMRAAARNVATALHANPSMTDAMKIDVGLNLRKAGKTAKPVPVEAPNLELLNLKGRTATVRLWQQLVKRAKPDAVLNALVFTFSGEAPPSELAGWNFAATTTSTTVAITFPPSPTGNRVWVAAVWVSATSAIGPISRFLSVDLPAAGALPSDDAATMRYARAA